MLMQILMYWPKQKSKDPPCMTTQNDYLYMHAVDEKDDTVLRAAV